MKKKLSTAMSRAEWVDKPWSRLPKTEMGPCVEGLVEGFKKDQAGRRATYVRNLELYENRSMNGYSAYSYSGPGSPSEPGERDRLRLIRSAVSSAVASIYAPQKPKPQFQTLGATWSTRRKAYKLDRICEGVLNQRQGRFINVWAFMADAAVDAALQGVAVVKVMADRVKKRIVHKLIPGPDVFTDPAEGRDPNNWFQREPIDESEALRLFPKAGHAIRGAKPYEWFGHPDAKRPRATKTIEIKYAWRLPFGPDDPGQWCAVINGEVVDSGEWTAPAPPFVMLVWEPHRDGPWASGIADEGGHVAIENGDLDLRLYHREVVASGKKIYYPRDSVKSDDLCLNDPTVGVPYDGPTPPNESLVPAFANIELDYLNQRIRHFWDSIGISQVTAAARREQGVESGVAMMTLNDTKAGRQLPKAQRYEQLYVDLAHQYVWRFRELAEEDEDFAVRWPGKTMLREYKWTDNDVADEEFNVSVAPSSALPHDPAGRQETIQTMYAGGLISQSRAKELMNWPDLDTELNVESAQTEYIDMLIERYLDAEQDKWGAYDYEPPEGFIFDKFSAMQRFVSAWARAKMSAATLPDEERVHSEFSIGLLVRYIKELDALMKPPEPEAPPAPAGAAMMPGQLPMRAPGGPAGLPPGPPPPPVMAA
jgi:hypothetical protein